MVPTAFALAALLAPSCTAFLLRNRHVVAEQPTRGPLCKKGKLLPELYIIGGKNTGTTSLYTDLALHSGLDAAPNDRTKEWNFWRTWESDHQSSSLSAVAVRQEKEEWFSALPKCPAQRKIIGDFSVTNLFLTPMGADMFHSRDYGFGGMAEDWNVPLHLKDIYGDLSSNITIVVILREPLARLQSEWYHTKPLHNCKGCMSKDTFGEALPFNIDLARKQPAEISDWLWKGYYARQLEDWFHYFDPSQFVIVPMKLYVGEDTELVPQALSRHLDTDLGEWYQASHLNGHFKPPLSKDAKPKDEAAFRELMEPENERLFRLLTDASLKGASLVGYDGGAGSESEVRQWLESQW